MDASPPLRTRALQLGLIVDVLDVLAAVDGVRRHRLSATGTIVAGGGAALFAVLGTMAISGERRAAGTTDPFQGSLRAG
jgi:hypothetical protein